MTKVIFLGSKPIGFKCLEYLIQNKEELDIEILGVLTNDNNRFGIGSSLSELAKCNNIPIIEDLESITMLIGIDYLISVQYHLILSKKHIQVANKMAINLHMAPLPDYRGCNQFSFAIFNGAQEFGTTLHRLEEGIDSGDILFETRFVVPENCLVKELYELTFTHSVELFQNSIGRIFKGDYTLTPQSDWYGVRSHRLYYRKDIEDLKVIDFSEAADEIVHKVRATSMPEFEPAYAMYDGRKYYIIPEENYNKL